MEKYRPQISLETDAVPPSASASNYGNRSSQHPHQAMFSRNRITDEEIFTHHPYYPRNSENHPLEPEDLVHFVVLYAQQNYGECQIFINWLQEILKKSKIDEVTIECYDSEIFPPHDVHCVTEICNRAIFILPFLTKEFCTDDTLKFFTVEGICLTRLDKSPISGEFSRINKSQKKYSIRPVHTEAEGVRSYRTPTGLTGTRGIDYYNKDRHKDYITNQVCGLAKEAIRKCRQRKDAMKDVLTGSEDFYARFESAFNMNNPPPFSGHVSSPQSVSQAECKGPVYYEFPSLQNSIDRNQNPPVDSLNNHGNSQTQQSVSTFPQGLEYRTQQNGGIQFETSAPDQNVRTHHQIREEDRISVQQQMLERHDQRNQVVVQNKTQIKDNVTRIGQIKKNIGISDQIGFYQNQKPELKECSGIATNMSSSEELMISGTLESSISDQNEKLLEACSEKSTDISSVDGRVLTNSRGCSATSDLCHMESHPPTESSGTSNQDSSASPLVTSESCGTCSQSSSATSVVPSDLCGTSSQDSSALSDNKISVQESGQNLIESGNEKNDDSFSEDGSLTLDAAPSTMPREVLSPQSHGSLHLDGKQNSKDSTQSERTQDTPDTPSQEHNVILREQSKQQNSLEVRQDSRNVGNVEEDLKLQQVNVVTKDDCDEGIKEDYVSYTGPAKMCQSKYASASTSMSDFKEQIGESDRRHEFHVHIHHHNPPVLQKPEKQSIVISNCNVVQIGEKSSVRKTTTFDEEEEGLTDSSFHSSNHEMSWNNLSSEIPNQNAANEMTECKVRSLSSSENEDRTSQSDNENFSQDNLPSGYESERGTQKIDNVGAHSQVESYNNTAGTHSQVEFYDNTTASDDREDERDSFLDEQLNDPSMPSLAPFEIGINQPCLPTTCEKGIDQSCRNIYRKKSYSYSYVRHVGELLGFKNCKDAQITDSMEEEID